MLVIEINHRIIQFQAWLLALAPPTRALDVPFDSMLSKVPVVRWICEQEPFTAFSKFGPGPRLMHIHGNGNSLVDISELSRLFYAHYGASATNGKAGKRSERMMVYFEFDRRDSRYDTISSMLTYLISIIMWHFWPARPTWVPEELSFLKTTRAWSPEDLYHLYATFRDGLQEAHKLTIFISCFDQCPEDQRKWFLQRVLEEQSYSEEQYRMILSTSTRDSLAVGSFPDEARINLANCPAVNESVDKLTKSLQLGLTGLVKRHSIFEYFRPQLESLLVECRDAPYLGHIILTWLRNQARGGLESEIGDMIDRLLPPTIDNIVYEFVTSLEPRLQTRATNAFNWVKHAAEPWSPASLVEALNGLDVKGTMQHIEKVFGGIIIVKNGDVKFSHPSFYHVSEIGINGSAEERAAKVNSEIAETCLRYFQLERAEKTLDKFSPENFKGGPWETALDAVMTSHPSVSFAEYAVRFWPQHYKASGQFKPHKLVRELFDSTEYRAGWEVPFWLFSNPLTRIQRSYISPMPVLAMLGLDDLVRGLVKNGSGQPFEKNCWFAITEAARVGNEKIVYLLLEEVEVDEEELRTALFWATAHGNANIVSALVKMIPNLKTFKWPENIIFRAAAVGMNELLATMLSSGCDINMTGSYWGKSLLGVAVWRNCVTTTELLLNRKPEPGLITKNGDDDTLGVAATKGNPCIISLLLQGGAGLKTGNEHNFGPVQLAVQWRKHKATEMFIKAGADFKSGEKGDDVTFYRRPPLVVAANVGSRECVRVLLNHKADPNVESATGTALYKAVMNNREDVVRLLLDHNPKPDMSVTPSGQAMLLIRAVCTGNAELVSLLIEHGAKVEAIDPNGDFYKTPLSWASKEGHLEIVKLLLKNKADINYTGGGSNAPLFAAIYGSQVEVAKYLLQYKNVDVKWKKSDGMGCLHVAYDLPDIMVELLKRGVPIDDYTKNYGTTLHMAARTNHPKSIEVLLRNDPKPDLECVYGENIRSAHEVGCTPLLLACLNLAPECVQLLLLAGANARTENENGDDGVNLVLRRGSDSKDAWECLRLLRIRGVPVNGVNKEGRGRLHYIQKKTPVSIVQLLLEGKAPLDGQDCYEYTPLAVAVREGNISVAKHLIGLGARVNVVGPNFGSILDLAIASGSLDLVRLLVESGADHKMVHPEYDGSLLYTALDIKDDSELQMMVQYLVDEVKVPLDEPGGELRYPIIRAANVARGNYDAGIKVLKFLIRRNAQLNVADSQGRTAAHFACAASYSDGIKALVEAGAAIYEDKFGRLPIHFAASARSPNCFMYLLDKFPDTDINVVDGDNWTPLMWAARSGHEETIKQLVKRRADVWTRGDDRDGQARWSALRLMNFADNCTSLRADLQPRKRKRIRADGKKEKWDPDFHETSIGRRKDVSCKSCLVVSINLPFCCYIGIYGQAK